MKKNIYYRCDDCFKPYEYPADTEERDFICPECGGDMYYIETCEIDESTNKVVKRYREEERVKNHPGRPIVTCPYCHSTNTRKLSGFERLAWSRSIKEWHCKTCDSDF